MNSVMKWLHNRRAKIDYKDCKVSLRGKKRPYPCFYGQSIDKPCTLRSTMRASKSSCEASI